MGFDQRIGSFHQDVLNGRWDIIGASGEMSEELSNRIKQNTFKVDDVDRLYRLNLQQEMPVISENYSDVKRPTSSMPKNCYGTAYGSGQIGRINDKVKEYIDDSDNNPDEIKDFFKDRCRDMRVILCQERKTSGTDVDDNRQIILDTYEQFRMSNSVMAKLSCDEEGKKIATEAGWTGDDKDWVYYNSDYYYKSEDLKNLFKEAAEELADEWGIEEINTSERDTDRYLSYSSTFNEVWNSASENGARICSMQDISDVPPRDFTLFYREKMENEKRTGEIYVGHRGGIETKKVIFDIYNDGVQQKLPQSYHLIDLLNTRNDDVNGYVSNLDIFTRYQGTVRLRKQGGE